MYRYDIKILKTEFKKRSPTQLQNTTMEPFYCKLTLHQISELSRL